MLQQQGKRLLENVPPCFLCHLRWERVYTVRAQLQGSLGKEGRRPGVQPCATTAQCFLSHCRNLKFEKEVWVITLHDFSEHIHTRAYACMHACMYVCAFSYVLLIKCVKL